MSNIVMFCKLFSCSTLQSPSKEHVNNEAVQVGVASDQCCVPRPRGPRVSQAIRLRDVGDSGCGC